MSETRHSGLVRVTHWLTALAFVGLVVSGVAVLLVHPRLYWGESGGVGAPASIDLPVRFYHDLSGWGRYLHFLCAWVAVLTGGVYVAWGIARGHFGRGMAGRYNNMQRVTYLAVIFGLYPLAIWTGLAMSPGLTSALPSIVTFWGGHQSARTVHFFLAVGLVVFTVGHVGMVAKNGFVSKVRGMVMGSEK